MTNFSWLQMVGKGVKYFVIFAASFIVMDLIARSSIADLTIVDLLSGTVIGKLTIGSIAVMALNWLKVKWGVKLP